MASVPGSAADLLLLAMTSTRYERVEIGRYEPARMAYRRFAALAGRMGPTFDRCTTLVSIVEDLRTGPAAALLWDGTERESVIGRLEAVLRSPGWSASLRPALGSADETARWRASWAASRIDAGFGGGAPFEIRVVLPDPRPVGFPQVETRILIDGRAVVAESFDNGIGEMPERLLDGRLRAGAEPREVRLAEAYCTEGCCGALYVTIVREGDEVVWRDWRTPGDPPGEFRFPADLYRTTDPRTVGDVVAGSRELAERLGFPWALEKTRW